LAERSILTAWRMRRVAGYETRQILLPIREQTDKHAAEDRQHRRQQEFLLWFGTAGDALPVSETMDIDLAGLPDGSPPLCRG